MRARVERGHPRAVRVAFFGDASRAPRRLPCRCGRGRASPRGGGYAALSDDELRRMPSADQYRATRSERRAEPPFRKRLRPHVGTGTTWIVTSGEPLSVRPTVRCRMRLASASRAPSIAREVVTERPTGRWAPIEPSTAPCGRCSSRPRTTDATGRDGRVVVPPHQQRSAALRAPCARMDAAAEGYGYLKPRRAAVPAEAQG